MAVTKIWAVHGTANATINYALDENKTKEQIEDVEREDVNNVLEYAANAGKTLQKQYVTGINCNAETAKEQFKTVKLQYGKTDGVMAYHACQSFAAGEVNPEQAHAIGVELAGRMWGDRFQVVVATHLNTDHLHNHFVVNSVSFRDGKKCRDKHWYKLNKVSDEICREHNLSIVERQGKHPSSKIAKAETEGKPTRLNLAKAAIDEAIKSCVTVNELKEVLRRMGYECKFDAHIKYWTIRQQDWKKPIRLVRMGDDYSAERIKERLKEVPNKPFSLFQKAGRNNGKAYNLPTWGDRARRRGGIMGLYLYYCYQLGYLPKYTRGNRRVSPELRDDLLKVERISEEARLLCREKLVTAEDLLAYKAKELGDMEMLTEERTELRKIIRTKIPEENKKPLRERISALNGELKEIRKELRQIESIEERSGMMQEKLISIKHREEREKHNRGYEHVR